MHALLVRKSGGKYKSQPNHVSTVTGETFYFAAPQETPAKTRELIEWFGAERKKADVNPIILAAVFHHRFISIHPFEEGSGIVARLLMNFILMQFDYPPAIFETEDKENYFAALRRADVGELEPLSDYVAQNLARSLETLIRGAKGEGVKEPDDFDKELALLKEKVRNVGKTVEISKNREVMLEIFEDSIKPLISKFIEVCRKFDDFYIKNHLFLVWDNAVASISKNEAEANAKSKILDKENFQNVSLDYNFVNFRQTGFNDFNFNSRITIRFELAKYKIILGEINRQEADRHSHYAHHDIYRQLGLEQPGYNAPKDEVEPEYEVCEKLYSERISAEEIENIVRIIANLHKEFIESEIEEKIDAKKRAAEFIDWS